MSPSPLTEMIISCLSKGGIRCIMLLLFQQNKAPEILEVFSKVQKMMEEIKLYSAMRSP